mgnify:CR=1 FL=1
MIKDMNLLGVEAGACGTGSMDVISALRPKGLHARAV